MIVFIVPSKETCYINFRIKLPSPPPPPLPSPAPSDFQLLTPEVVLLSNSRPIQAEVRITLPQKQLEDNDDLNVESLILVLNDELELAPADVFFRMSIVNILDTG